MNHYTKLMLLLSLSLVFLTAGCEKEERQWNPLVEETGFNYLSTEVEGAISLINAALNEADRNQPEGIKENLRSAKSKLLELKDYYVPLTIVRQKIYDSERFFKLDNVQKSKALLEESKSIISSLDGTTQNAWFDKVALKTISMINEVIASFDENSKTNTYNKMKEVGEHVNLILIKGDLVLSEIEFEK